MKKPLKVHWYNCGPRAGNFGDCLTPLICEALAGRTVQYAEIANADLIAVGSLLEPHFFESGSWDEYSGSVWGAGRMYGDRDKLRLTKAHVAALRGALTLENVILADDDDLPLGDPVLLSAPLARTLDKRFKLGLVPHQSEYDQPIFCEVAKHSSEITLIDVCGGVRNVLDQIAQCEFLLSSALHALVAADALGIPNQWLWLEHSDHDQAGKPAFKYRDYYSVFGLQNKKPIQLLPHDSLDDILARFEPYERPGMEQIQKRLMDAFPFASTDSTAAFARHLFQPRRMDAHVRPVAESTDMESDSTMPELNPESKADIGLCMIVKNEAHVIERCLASVRSFISRWTIVDTGSSDSTQERIRELLADMPGELHERPWVDFAHNRSEALALAAPRSDYLLIIDADDILEAAPDFVMPRLTDDAYWLSIVDKNLRYDRVQLVRSACNWRYEGVLHEYPTCDNEQSRGRLPGLTYHRLGGGARSQNPDKFLKDARVLQSALEREPENARYAFYLAQSWRDAGCPHEALEAYRRRIELGGWAEEVWCSMNEVAKLVEKAGADHDTVVGAYLRAYEFRPTRAESLTRLAMYLRHGKHWPTAYLFASAALQIPRPADTLFVDDPVYAWQALDEVGVSSYWLGRYQESADACRQLLSEGHLPPHEISRVEKNLAFAEEHLSQSRSSAKPE